MKYISSLIESIFPHHCQLCQQASTKYLCPLCTESLPWNLTACQQCAMPIEQNGGYCGSCLASPPIFNRVIAPFRYQPPISTFITQFKFQQNLLQGRMLSQLLTTMVQSQYDSQVLPEYIIAIPLHSRRLRQRGFNQALEIAKPLARQLNIPLLYNHYYRQKHTLPQTQLSAAKRKHNLAGAFKSHRTITAQHVAVVDDVMTTGQTVRRFSQLLRSQGIKKIDIWCCARAV